MTERLAHSLNNSLEFVEKVLGNHLKSCVKIVATNAQLFFICLKFTSDYGQRHGLRSFMMDLNTKVQVVDDYATMRRILHGLLLQIGFKHIDDAGDGGAALAKLRERGFGLVISDWNMAPMSGLEFLKEVRSDNQLKNTP